MKHTLASLVTIAGLAAGSFCAHAATIAVTGLNEDIIVDAGSASYSTTTTGGVIGGQEWTLVQAGYTGASSGSLSGTGLNIVGDTVTTQNGTVFAVDPDANNALLDDGTLTLVTSGQYENLQFLFFTVSGSVSVTLNFDDASSTLFSSPAFSDWQGSSVDNAFAASSNAEEINAIRTSSGAVITLNPREYGITLSAVDQAKTLESITFDFPSVQRGSVLAVSGTVIPEPSSILLGGLGSLLLLRRRR